MNEQLQQVTKKKDLMKIIQEHDLPHRQVTFKTLAVTHQGTIYYYQITSYKTVAFTHKETKA